MRRFLVRFIRPETFVHTRSSAGFTITTVRQESLMLPAGEIPAPERGTSRPTGNRALVSWRQRHELSVGTSDERAVTQVKRLSLVMIINRRPTASYWLEGNSR